MNTRSIARAGLGCALFGVLLVLGSLSGLWLQSTAPFVYALPILYLSAAQPFRESACAAVAMFLLSLLFGSMMTWICVWSMLLCGYILGQALQTGSSLWKAAAMAVLIDSAALFISMGILAALTGYDLSAERVLYERIASFVSWNGFLGLVSLSLALLEVIPLVCLSILAVLKRRIPLPPAVSLNLRLDVPSWCAWSFAASILLWSLMAAGVISCPVGLKDLAAWAAWISLPALIAQGAAIWLERLANRHAPRWKIAAAVLIILLPGPDLYPAALGFFHLMTESFTKKETL